MNHLTKGSMEAEIANAVVRFHREQQGRGPADVRTFIIRDLVIVRCMGILTQTEVRLAETEEGRRLIRSARQELRSINQTEIDEIVAKIAGSAVLRSYCDINVESAELMEVYVLDRDLEAEFFSVKSQTLRTPGKENE
jgi:uncharacterized protein YbcI